MNPYSREPHQGGEPQAYKDVEKKGESDGLGWLWKALRRRSSVSMAWVGRRHSQWDAPGYELLHGRVYNSPIMPCIWQVPDDYSLFVGVGGQKRNTGKTPIQLKFIGLVCEEAGPTELGDVHLGTTGQEVVYTGWGLSMDVVDSKPIFPEYPGLMLPSTLLPQPQRECSKTSH